MAANYYLVKGMQLLNILIVEKEYPEEEKLGFHQNRYRNMKNWDML